jgi:hypothetical protein
MYRNTRNFEHRHIIHSAVKRKTRNALETEHYLWEVKGCKLSWAGTHIVFSRIHTSVYTPRSTVLQKPAGPHLVTKFPVFHGNEEVHYRIHNSPPPVPLVSKINPVHGPSHFLGTRLNIILPSTPISFKLPPSLRFPYQNPLYTRTSVHRHTGVNKFSGSLRVRSKFQMPEEWYEASSI